MNIFPLTCSAIHPPRLFWSRFPLCIFEISVIKMSAFLAHVIEQDGIRLVALKAPKIYI